MINNILNRIIPGSIALVALLVAGVSCQKNTFESGDNLSFIVSTENDPEVVKSAGAISLTDESGKNVIDFICSVEPKVTERYQQETKATQINGARDNLFYNNGFAIYGFNSSGTKVIDGVNVSLTSQSGTSDAKGTPATSYSWPRSQRMSFVGYYPKTESIFSGATATSAWDFSYTVPTTAADQTDLMLAYFTGLGSEGSAQMNFTHPLTSVRFKMGTIDSSLGAVTSITLKNVYSQGTCTVTPNQSDNSLSYSWDASGSTDVRGTGTGSISTGTTLGSEFTFIVIPQDFSDQSAVIQIAFSDGTICSATLASGEWEYGKTNLYSVSTDGGYVYVIDQVSDITRDYEGGIDNAVISSYKTNDGGVTKIPVGWKVRYKETGASNWSDSTPSWLVHTISTSASPATSTSTTFETGVMPEIMDSRAQALNSAITAKKTDPAWQSSSDSRIDLSRGGETANCYVVNASGYFKLPLIYGNARNSDGSTNTLSFDPQGQFRDHLLNYRGHNITNMWIPDDDGGIALKDAVLVWQDERNLITNVHLNGNYLEFDISDDNAMQGNAVVAVRDNNDNIVWSWHIWVTDYVLGTDDSVFSRGDYTYTYMGREIGWCDPKKVTYGELPRSCDIQVYQDCPNGAVMQFTYGQNNQVFENNFCCTMYEHGRKDPENGIFLDAMTGELRRKSEFVDNAQYAYSVNQSKASLAESIMNPHTHYCLGGDGSGYWTKDYDYQYLWDSVRKTVYDPSPVGYRVPAGDSFKYFADMECQKCTDPDGYRIKDSSGNFTIFFLAANMNHWTLGIPADKGGVSHWGAGLYAGSPSERGSLGFVFYHNGTRLCQGWTSGPAGYPVKPIAGN